MMTNWQKEAMREILAEMNRRAETHLLKIWLPQHKDNILYLKDESIHSTGSIKHRLARSLYIYALSNGAIDKDTLILEASSGNTAIAEAYFAHLLGLPFMAVIPSNTSKDKIIKLQQYQARYHFIDDTWLDRSVAKKLAIEKNGYFMDQFSFAERVLEWKDSCNIAHCIFQQLQKERFPEPRFMVCGAGTGGTATTLGRYVRYSLRNTEICVADPEDSVLSTYFQTRDLTVTSKKRSRIEGIGRSYVPSSFFPNVVSRMITVPDAASIATILFLKEQLGLRFGGSTGATVYASLQLMAEMRAQSQPGSVVAIAADNGNLYENTYYNEAWRKDNHIDVAPYLEQLSHLFTTGEWLA